MKKVSSGEDEEGEGREAEEEDLYNGILLYHKNKANLIICVNMDGPTGYYAKWNNQTKKDKYHIV